MQFSPTATAKTGNQLKSISPCMYHVAIIDNNVIDNNQSSGDIRHCVRVIIYGNLGDM